MKFVRLIHRRIDGKHRQSVDAHAVLHAKGWNNRDFVEKISAALRFHDHEKALALLKKGPKRGDANDEFPGAMAQAFEILSRDVQDVTAYAYVCMDKDSVIHSIVEGEVKLVNGRDTEVEDLPTDGDGLSQCVLYWRTGVLRHLDMPALEVIKAFDGEVLGG